MSEVIEYYSSFDEWGRLDREPLEFKVNLHYIRKYLPQYGHVLDNGAGPGKYSMELAKLGYKVTLADLTPQLVNIAKEKSIELGLEQHFNGFYIRDAKNLNGIPNEQYDASLMLGPLYHLQTEEDRQSAVSELYRVTKYKGVVFVAFMSRISKVQQCLISPQRWKPLDNMSSISMFHETGIFNHTDKGRFTGGYFFNINEIKPFMESNGFETIELIGSTKFRSMAHVGTLELLGYS